MLALYLFFIPGALTLIDFIYYTIKGEKLFDHFGGLLLDGIQLIGYPIFFSTVFPYLGGRSMLVFSASWVWLTVPLTVLSILGYFAIRYAYLFLSETLTIVILTLLSCGIFINVSMIHDGLGINAYFNISIILLYIMQIAITVKRHIKD